MKRDFTRFWTDDSTDPPLDAAALRRVVSGILLAVLLFVLDAIVFPGGAIAVGYAVSLAILGGSGKRCWLLALSISCTALSLAAFFLAHGLKPDREALHTLALVVGVNVLATALMLRHRAQRVLLEAQARLINSSSDAIVLCDLDGRILFWNEGAAKLFDWCTEDALGQIAHQLLRTQFPAPFAEVRRNLVETGDLRLELIMKRRDGSRVHTMSHWSLLHDHRGRPATILETSIDITERVAIQHALDRTRAELEEKSRAAMLGEISGSIAHEVSQPLAAVKTSAQAAMRWLDKSPPDLTEANLALQDVIKATELADEIVKRVRSLLGKARTEREMVSVSDAIGGAIRLKSPELERNGIHPKLKLRADNPTILGDRILIQQVLINVLTNAIQSLDQVPVTERDLVITSNASDGKVTIEIADTGTGLAHAGTIDLFRAFSSTKLDGMGIGLATSRSIVAAHNGSISIENRQDRRGARVRIVLPLLEGSCVSQQRSGIYAEGN